MSAQDAAAVSDVLTPTGFDEPSPPLRRAGRVSRATLVELAALFALGLAYTVIRAAQGTDVAAAFAHARRSPRSSIGWCPIWRSS